uniref:Cytochrome c oxidase subunit 7A2 n=1 Tax=Amphimedon queenslandica TaxID=400682 RepID=A0A1X7UH45_AMPQE
MHPYAKRIKMYQRIFQNRTGPHHLRGGKADLLLYRSAVGACFFGLAAVSYTFYLMATNQMPKNS